MKEIRNGTTLFLIFIVIFAFSAQGSQQVLQLLCLNSPSSLETDKVKPLRKNTLLPVHTPRTGIIPNSNKPRSPRGSINDIEEEQDQYFPGSNISIRNQFEILYPGSGYSVIGQVIYIFLFEEGTAQSTMAAQGDITNSSIYFVHNATTNGDYFTREGAALSTNVSHGWIETTFEIPEIGQLTEMGIESDDNVTIFQYYPAQNVSKSSLGTDFNITRTDTFQLSSVATFTSEGFVNDASSDEVFRQGENATTLLTAASGATGIDNVTVTISGLYNKSNDVEITDPASLGIQYELRDPLLGTPSTTTNTDGEIELFVNTTDSTLEGGYYFNVTADFTWTSFYTENYGKKTNATADFTVQNVWDYVDFVELQAVPPSLDPPVQNTTIVTVRLRAQYAYDTQPYYYLREIPVTASLDSYPTGVTLAVAPGFAFSGTPGYYLTNSTGQIAFNITAEYPLLYSDIVSNINITANLTSVSKPIYPYTSSTYRLPHRFLRGAGDTLYISTDDDVSINPDFWIGDIRYSDSNTTNIHPGESALVKYEVFSTQTSDKFIDVPVKIELANPIPGVALHFDFNLIAHGNYRFTDANGIIYVKVSTTYLTTPEYIQTVPLDITIDFENDSNLRWIGNSNAINDWGWADTLQNFNKTWRDTQTTDITINPAFNNCTISFSTTNETGNTVIRPGDDLTVYFIVRNEDATPLINVPANVSFVDYTAMKSNGVSLTIHPGSGPLQRPGYYNTTGSGYIFVIISTEYGTTPKNLDIDLIATADFENDSQDKWYVGSKGVRSDFRSNSSYSEDTRRITVAPQYFTGYVYIPTDNPPNATLVQHNEVLQTEFRLRLSYSGGNVFPNIDGLNISIQINDTDPANWNMGVTPAIYQDSDDSSISFYIQMNATGLTPEAMYNLTVTADFGSIKDRIYNFTSPYPSTVPSGKLSGVWVNGTDATGNYSYVTTMFEVKNIDLIRVWIPSGGVTDLAHPDAGFNSTTGLFEVYRGTTNIVIEGTYKDNTQDPVQNELIHIYMNHSDAIMVPLDTNVMTDGQGEFSTIISLPDNTPLGDNVTIYGLDPTPPTPREGREGVNETRVVTTIDLSDYTIGNFNGTSAFVIVGGSVTISGTLIDDQGLPIISINSPFSYTFSELNNNLRVIGWNGTHEIGVPNIASPNADGTYDLTYQIPYNYNQDTLSIRLNITNSVLNHYRANYTQTPVNVYWDFQIDNLEIYFPSNGTSTGLNSGTTYLVSGLQNRDIVLRGTLVDSSGRGLGGKWISTTWNDTIFPPPDGTLPDGNFSLDYSFTGLENDTWIWEIHHLLDNGTELSKSYIITLNWEVFDIAAPVITILSPTENQTSPGVALLLLNDITEISVTVEDPSLADVSDGLDNSSVVVQINGVNYTMNQDAGQ
ncbi:MAG: hypothetical protein ACW991_02165, partial [Candidatus Hodarchaeales archaeon]